MAADTQVKGKLVSSLQTGECLLGQRGQRGSFWVGRGRRQETGGRGKEVLEDEDSG